MDFENNISINSTAQFLSPHRLVGGDSFNSATLSSTQPNVTQSTLFSSLDDTKSSPTGLTLKQQVMLNQFVSITGCSCEQSIQILASSNWQYQTALSLFFDEFSILTNNKQFLQNTAPLVPCSTPVTPPNLDYLEKAFSKLNSSSSNSCSLSSSTQVNTQFASLNSAVPANSSTELTNHQNYYLNNIGSKICSTPIQMPVSSNTANSNFKFY